MIKSNSHAFQGSQPCKGTLCPETQDQAQSCLHVPKVALNNRATHRVMAVYSTEDY